MKPLAGLPLAAESKNWRLVSTLLDVEMSSCSPVVSYCCFNFSPKYGNTRRTENYLPGDPLCPMNLPAYKPSIFWS
jgi:hypothetical protein